MERREQSLSGSIELVNLQSLGWIKIEVGVRVGNAEWLPASEAADAAKR